MAKTGNDMAIELCLTCANHFALDEGWAGYCPACLALSDEHLAGLHDAHVVDECRDCLGSHAQPVRAIA